MNRKILTDEAFERTKPCREGHLCCHNNNFGGELCADCHIDPDEDYKNEQPFVQMFIKLPEKLPKHYGRATKIKGI